ncbi:histidine phosphatase family protein [Streptococcus cuniculi]|uniref:Histidine phosphatase family protein n=1 Tax=Streptococcus cuniculi TaxID=1432788 RepID=A0A4Y9JBU9_9STRE|nr:histidine phosphatase family protein [Streptococcus cuniculi]MBF0778794.1 histidine phosphatase family protein [Streptococcus cuniculi]TFU97295.1 histidine phosphatase family protein [Streptococcus cuniculi]
MTETRLYIARHGKTMFNTIGRIQGWCDTPLTKIGEKGIRELGLGLKEAGLEFKVAVSSDLGRTVQTITIAQRELGILGKIPYYQDKRLREWCFGSFEGMYDAELFSGVLPRISGIVDAGTMTFEEIANGVHEADSANWSEPWEVLKDRILNGFESIAADLEKQGGGNALIVSHGMTIATLVNLLAPERPTNLALDNGSVTVLKYENGQFSIEAVGDMSYRKAGASVIQAHDE